MEKHIIFTTKLTNYHANFWEGQALYKLYSKLKNFLIKQLGEEFAYLFAEPHITDIAFLNKGQASWSSEYVTNKAVALSTLPENVQNNYKYELKSKIDVLLEFANRLLLSDNKEDKKWGEIITLAIDIPDFSHVFFEEGKFCLVAWGFVYEKNENKVFDLRKELPKISQLPKIDDLQTNSVDIINENNYQDKNDNISENNNSKKETYQNDIENQEVNKNVNKEELINNDENSSNQEEYNKKTINKTSHKGDTNIPPTISGKNIKTWWKKFWWIIPLLFMILLIFFLKYCNFEKNYLPPEASVVVPIDTTKIVNDPDSVRKIVSNRLNVAITAKNQHIRDFARKFKKLYPGEYYQIIYYDTVTMRLQLLVPESEREIIKNNLPKQMPEFELLIWYEGIFQRNYKPTDPGFNDLEKYWWHILVKSLEAWKITKGNPDLIVAIIDDGFDLTQPEFRGKIVSPWNVPAHSSKVNIVKNSHHGTHVAGIAIGLANNGYGVAGIAPECKFMPIQVGDQNGFVSTTSVIDGILYAIRHGASVINISLGMAVVPGTENLPQNVQMEMIRNLYKDEEKFWQELFEIAHRKNVTIVLAGGNQNVLIGLDPMQRSAYAIKVSAVTPDQLKANFSNYGPFSTISAPGVHIFSSLPNHQFGYSDGTSMAAPIVTGGIALIKSVNPALTTEQIIDLIQSTGVPVKNYGSYIGNIIQLDKAVSIANISRKKMPKVNCPDIQRKIDSLLQEIENIKRLCQSDSLSNDTLKIPKQNSDLSFAVGRWRSTTYIYNNIGEKITIYFDFFADGTGRITLIEPDNTECTAKLSLNFKPGLLIIDQLTFAKCVPDNRSYNSYYFECKPDEFGYADCYAQNKMQKANNFRFKLIKLKK